AIVQGAARVCGIEDVALRFVEGTRMAALSAHHGGVPRLSEPWPISLEQSSGTVMGAVVRGRTTIAFDDTAEQDDYPSSRDMARNLGTRSSIWVPLLAGKDCIGVLYGRRSEVRPFSRAEAQFLET